MAVVLAQEGAGEMISLSNFGALPTDRPPDIKTSLDFPKTSCSLWDKTALGNPLFLHIGYFRKPKICIPEKILRLIQHQCENYSQTHHMMLGSLVVEEDGEGIQVQVDRLDTRTKIPSDGSGLAPGDILIPLEVSNNTDRERLGSVEDYHCALKRLQSRCCSKASVDLCEFVLLRGWGSYYSNAHSSVVHLDFDMVTMETLFKATPIAPVPILLTALSKNLAGPMSLSQMQGTTKTGYLSMDHTRKLLLVLESDPKACSLPLIGIWVSGAEFVQHPFVWASCLRYIYNTHLQDRVCLPPNEFLLVVYTPLHSRPEFYQCSPTSDSCDFQFQLRTGHEVTNMTKALSAPSQSFTEIELDAVEGGTKMELFDAAKAEHGLDISKTHSSRVRENGPEDIEPRCVPTPHMDKVHSIRPMVPDVSILWTEPSELFPSYQQQQQFSAPASQHSIQQLSFQHASQGQLQQDYKPQYPSRSSHFTPMSTVQRAIAPKYHNHSYDSQPNQSTQVQQIKQAQIATSYRSFALSNSVNYPINSLPRHKTPQQYVDSAQYGPQNIKNFMPQVHQPNKLPSVSYGAFGSSMSPQTLPGLILSSSATPFTPCAPSRSEYPNETTGNATLQVSKSSFVPPFNNVAILPCSSSAEKDKNVPSCMPSITASSLQNHDQVPNSQHHVKTIPYLTTVVEESSSSQSSSSSSLPNTRAPHNLNGNILALSSQSLGFNSTRGNGSSHNNSRSNSAGTCQSSDDDDSGLSITPDKVNIFPSQHSIPSAVQSQRATCSTGTESSGGHNHILNSSSSASAFAAETRCEPGIDSIKWDDVSPAVRALLEHQNQQLKVLQLQIQTLLHNQSQQSALTINQSQKAGSSVNPSPPTMPSTHKQICQQNPNNLTESHDRTTETCSVGVNTTILDDSNNQHTALDSHSVQTSPVKLGYQNFVVSPVLGERSNDSNINEGLSAGGSTPLELQHHGHPPISSTTYETPKAVSRGRASDKSNSCVDERKLDDLDEEPALSQNELVSAIAGLPIQDQTMNTVASELVVDMPDYASTIHDGIGLDQSCSPPSVSKCFGPDQDDSYSTVAEDAMDPKQYYSQLMNNIQMFLTNDKNQETDISDADATSALKASSPQRYGGESSTNSSLIPRINYVSMMLGTSVCNSPVKGSPAWDTDPGQSMEINAMAMKYLSDEELTQMALFRQMQSMSDDTQTKETTRALQRVMEKQHYTANLSSLADISRLGISPNNMTMATQNYLQKHGLLSNENSMMITPGRGANDHGPSMFDPSFKLRTDFSLAQSSLSKSISGSKPCGCDHVQQLVSTKSPHAQNVLHTALGVTKPDSPQLLDEHINSPDSAEAVLRPINSKENAPSGNIKGFKTRPLIERSEQAHYPFQKLPNRHSANFRQNDSASTDDPDEENILDIARLKQMPKLL